MSISPSTLFHFTNKNALFDILRDNFKLKYCLEKLPNDKEDGKIAVPMVSFCDIKISEITEHIEKYGEYGIGLSKDWANEKKLSPVFYQNLKSEFSTNFRANIKEFLDDINIDLKHKGTIIDLLRLSKEYEGKLIRRTEEIEKYRFADEREWRFVPRMTLNREIPDFINEEHYNTPEKKQNANDKLKDERLYFNANNIMYLIVKEESEINELINHIRQVKGKNYTMDEVDRLTTRIISCERIINDF
ncbi:hypothetical protein DIS18_12140 [Algibacter marinivivus]|uniref:Abortive phage resistance protein AbiGi, antitoxin n=1 Tax=Algibacter marinivivus TaxID=2100723 RepID=A0A2U2X2K8_9FLAO|nr:abortive infection system antitoxin AbiGi family protein [Algibacter marinivivus]PWH82010.1 hypothetical protein DIS18_12140 [Algibacter marinivivus]